MLKPLDNNLPIVGRIIPDTIEPTRTCEACGKKGISSSMINIIIVVGSPGHASLKPFQCSQEEHWSCSPDCWSKVAHACIDEHMSILLKSTRETLGL